MWLPRLNKRPCVFLSRCQSGQHQGATLVLVLMIIFLCYGPALQGDFLNWDDPQHLLENPQVRSLALPNLRRIFLSKVQTVYIPLTVISFALEYHFFGYLPVVYHLNNILLHLAVCGLIFFFAQNLGLTRSGAALATLIFGLHPVHVESVAWVTERKDVLYAAFYMGAMIVYWRYLKTRKKGMLWAASALGLLSLLAKPMALSLPLIFVLLDWKEGRKMSGASLAEKIPLALLMLPVILLTWLGQPREPLPDLWAAVLLWVWSVMFYLSKFFVPMQFLPIYEIPLPVTLTNPVYGGSVAASIMTAIVLTFLRKNKDLIFAFAFYFASIFFLLRFNTSVGVSQFADRFLYLPCLGFCLFIGKTTAEMCAKRSNITNPAAVMARIFPVLLCLFLFLKTSSQIRIWNNSLSFWNFVISRTSSQALAFNNRGIIHTQREDYAQAIADFQEAIQRKPDYYEAYVNLGIVYARLSELSKALESYDNAIKINPDLAKAYASRAIVYSQMKEYVLSLAEWDKAIAIPGDHSRHLNSRGAVYEALGEEEKALADYSQAIIRDPYFADPYHHRAVLLAKRQEFQSALRDFHQAIRLDPQDGQFLFNRGVLYLNMGQIPKAREDFGKARSLGHPVPGPIMELLNIKS